MRERAKLLMLYNDLIIYVTRFANTFKLKHEFIPISHSIRKESLMKNNKEIINT